MDTATECSDCRFFHREYAPAEQPLVAEGECRRHPPVVGELLTDRHGETFRHYGEWPRVMDSDWCGSFDPKR